MKLHPNSTQCRRLLQSLLLAILFVPATWAADGTYLVKKGDTLTDIARDHHLSVAALAKHNGVSRHYRVKAGERLKIPGASSSHASSSSEFTYLVKRGDTLYDIAKANGISVTLLAERNDLSKNYHVRIGQRLVIPESRNRSATSGKDSSAVLPEAIRKAIADARVRKGRWKYIVIHHSGVDEGTVKGMDRYHREVRHMENGLAYHFVIGNGHGMGNGEIAVGPRWTKQLDGGHLASLAQDKIAIGICLVGNFDKHPPSAKQLKSLHALVEALMRRCNLTPKAVKTHKQINIIGTRCPGSKFPTKSFIKGLE